jgi:hypothetical protein
VGTAAALLLAAGGAGGGVKSGALAVGLFVCASNPLELIEKGAGPAGAAFVPGKTAPDRLNAEARRAATPTAASRAPHRDRTVTIA